MFEWAQIAVNISILFLFFLSYKEKKNMQKTIDALTNKLMARDYKEYASMQPQEAAKEEPKKKKKMSWYDDEHEEEGAVN